MNGNPSTRFQHPDEIVGIQLGVSVKVCNDAEDRIIAILAPLEVEPFLRFFGSSEGGAAAIGFSVVTHFALAHFLGLSTFALTLQEMVLVVLCVPNGVKQVTLHDWWCLGMKPSVAHRGGNAVGASPSLLSRTGAPAAGWLRVAYDLDTTPSARELLEGPVRLILMSTLSAVAIASAVAALLFLTCSRMAALCLRYSW